MISFGDALTAVGVARLEDLGEVIRANLAAGFPLAWHNGHVSTVDHIGDDVTFGVPLYYCHACGEDDSISRARVLPVPRS